MTATLDDVESLVRLSPRDETARPRLAAVVSRLRERDAVLLERILRELLPSVRRWTFRMLGPHGELDDAVQDAMTEIASALHRFDGRASVSTLAHTIVVRTTYRFFRRAGRNAALDFDAEASDAASPEAQAETREAMTRLYECLARLPENRRVAFVLCVVEGLGPSEAAELVGCSPLAMRTRLHHARAEVEHAMREHDTRRPR